MQILLIFLQKMDLLLTKAPAEDIKNSVLPMVYRALETPSVQIQVHHCTVIDVLTIVLQFSNSAFIKPYLCLSRSCA